jgi:hypothetical protein
MATINIVLRDTEEGLVDVETTIHEGWTNTNAVALAGRIREFLDEIAEDKTPRIEVVGG